MSESGIGLPLPVTAASGCRVACVARPTVGASGVFVLEAAILDRCPPALETARNTDARPDSPVRLTRPPLVILLPLLQLPLILNPGYFAHDEIEWWARADVPAWTALPWISWLDLSPLQYRPLTFNLWLLLAHACAATPWLMHLAFVLLGTANACLLARVLTAARVPERSAYAAAIVFSLWPYVVYTHGWTGTLADLLTLACGLLAARCLQQAAAASSAGAATLLVGGSVLLVAVALLCKESAIVLPLLLTLAAYGQRFHRTIRLGLVLSVAVVALYLAMRLPVLADSGQVDPAYAWSLRHAPARLAEYSLFPFMPPLFEIGPLLSKSAVRIAAAAGCVTLFFTALSTAGWRWPLVTLTAFCAALAPVLLLPASYDHYAYLASAVAIGIVAAAWPDLGRAARATVLALAAIGMLHGAIVMSRIHAIGIVQRNLYDDLTRDLRDSPASLHIAAADPRDAWLLGRLLAHVDAYRGMPFGGRVRFGDEMPARTSDRLLTMNRNGHLHPDTPL